MSVDIRSDKNNHFGGFTVKKRIIDFGDRSISIPNISSINIAESNPGRILVLMAFLGSLSLMLSAYESSSYYSSNKITEIFFVLGIILIAPIVFSLITKETYLVISSNDGTKAVLSSRNFPFLRKVKAALDEKINNENVENSFVANFHKGSIEKLDVGTLNTNTVDGETIISHSPGSVVASHSPGAQLGEGNVSTDNEFNIKHSDRQSITPQTEQDAVPNLYDPHPASRKAEASYSPFFIKENTVHHSAGAQIGNNNISNNNQFNIDFSRHIEHVETIKNGINDPEHIEKLDEMLVIMRSGISTPASTNKLRTYAHDFATYLQAYPPLSKIFQDILNVLG